MTTIDLKPKDPPFHHPAVPDVSVMHEHDRTQLVVSRGETYICVDMDDGELETLAQALSNTLNTRRKLKAGS